MPRSQKFFNTIGYIYITLIALLCLLPFWLILVGSFSKESDIIANGYSLWPLHWSLGAYQAVFMFPGVIIRAYGITILVTVCGTAFGLFFISMAGFVLSRRDFRYRNAVSFFIYFTTLFSGGLIPWYLMVTNVLHMKDTLFALIVPGLMNCFLIILMKSFLKSVPEEIAESAKIDGAGDFRIYISLVMPLAKPALATIGLFLALDYWNNWFFSSIFITNQHNYSLQYVLYSILQSAKFYQTMSKIAVPIGFHMPLETIKLATAVIATGPVILFYPFVQKYFVQGLTIGAVKG